MKIIYTGNCLTLSEGENVKIINSDNVDFDNLKNWYKSEQFEKLEQYLNGFKNTIEKAFKKNGVSVLEGIVFVDEEVLPASLGNKVLTLAKDNLPIDRFIKFWHKLKENPSYTAVQAIFSFLERNNLPIMEDGNLIGYKAVKEDWTDKYSGKFLNTVEFTLKINRRLVDDNTELDCSYGFHVGSQTYVKNFAKDGDRILEVVVNPKDVVSVPNEAMCNKIRVCEYFVKGELNPADFAILEPPTYYSEVNDMIEDDDEDIEIDDYDELDDYDYDTDDDDLEDDDEDY